MFELTRAEWARLEWLVRGLVTIGERLPNASRAFYVAWATPLRFKGCNIARRIGQGLGVGDLSPEAILWAEWYEAGYDGDQQTCRCIEKRLAAVGVAREAVASVAAAREGLALVRATLPALIREPRKDESHA